jgi:hypothetical protein
MIKCTCGGSYCKRYVTIIESKDTKNEFGLLMNTNKESKFIFMDFNTINELINELKECLVKINNKEK